MKKLLAIGLKLVCWSLFLLTGNPRSFGQTNSSAAGDCLSGSRLCIQGSVDFTNLTFSGSGVTNTDHTRTGFDLGVFLVHPFFTSTTQGGLAVKEGLEFVEKGAKVIGAADNNGTVALNYLEIPVDLLCEFKLPNCNALFGGLGPYIAYGIGGKQKATNVSGQTVSMNSFSDSTGKRFDFGLNFTAGCQLGGSWSASVAYELGLINIYNSGSSSYSTKNRGWTINLAFCLAGLFKK